MDEIDDDVVAIKQYRANLSARVNYNLLNNSTLYNSVDHNIVQDRLRDDFDYLIKNNQNFVEYPNFFEESNVRLLSHAISVSEPFTYCGLDHDKKFSDGVHEYTINKYSTLVDFELLVDDSKIVDVLELYKMSNEIINNTVLWRTGSLLQSFWEDEVSYGVFGADRNSIANNLSYLIGYSSEKVYEKFDIVVVD